MIVRDLAAETNMTQPLDPGHIMQVGMGFWASKTLLSAVELGLFSALADGALTGAALGQKLSLHARAIPDFPDALVALGLLQRAGEGADATYANTPATKQFLDRASPAYLGGFLEMANARLYRSWGDLTEGLQTGQAQNEIKHPGTSMFATLYEEPARLEQFMSAMRGISAANFRQFAQTFDFSKYQTLCDVGGASGQLACAVAEAQPHLRCATVDLPKVVPIAARYIREAGLTSRVQSASCDFFSEPFPKADVITMGMILHDWNLEKKKFLVKKAYDALPPGGAFVVIETLIDDARRENAFGLLMSLNMLIQFGDAFDYSARDFTRWCQEAGFTEVKVLKLAGPSSAAIAYK